MFKFIFSPAINAAKIFTFFIVNNFAKINKNNM